MTLTVPLKKPELDGSLSEEDDCDSHYDDRCLGLRDFRSFNACEL